MQHNGGRSMNAAKKVDASTQDAGFAAFVCVFHEVPCTRITTDATGQPTFHFMVNSPARFETQWPEQYSSVPIIDAKTFAPELLSLQNRARQAHVKGGIWRA